MTGCPYASLKFFVNAYSTEVQNTYHQDLSCSATIFGPDTGPISGVPNYSPKVKRSGPSVNQAPATRRPWMRKRLIVSNLTNQTAEDLCGSATSWGPDFVGSDGKFCDMSTKKVSPLCSNEHVEGCVEMNQDRSVITKRSITRRTVETTKTYDVVSTWGNEQE
ncbi:hypothetical protein E4T38_01481 [Aureobasidium subglaciale]|nr:hypothetical protein E4T38_01481 [Aureobasidium subglaciale]KAI5229804.1 hypothetical protein E4T40_01482 [Aureobasidium subglaciale]KAI5233378.1 hypothetical protein E4T41_01479 [Aureobasidium subglaciale]KAI5266671.1 hypothetical protein E4T46_01481 [Aureobasidium subglaciale]